LIDIARDANGYECGRWAQTLAKCFNPIEGQVGPVDADCGETEAGVE